MYILYIYKCIYYIYINVYIIYIYVYINSLIFGDIEDSEYFLWTQLLCH